MARMGVANGRYVARVAGRGKPVADRGSDPAPGNRRLPLRRLARDEQKQSGAGTDGPLQPLVEQ